MTTNATLVAMKKPTYLTARQAAERLGVHRATVYRWIESGDLDAEEIAGHTLIRESSVTKKLKQRKGSL